MKEMRKGGTPAESLRQEVLVRELASLLDRKGRTIADGDEMTVLCQGIDVLISSRLVWESVGKSIESKRGVEFSVRKCYETVNANRAVITPTGKGRLFLRHLLKSGGLSAALCYLHTSPSVLDLAGKLDAVCWELDLSNSCWLDSSWQLPQLETHLLVPAADLGVYVSLADGRPVVTQVVSGSVAAEDGKVEIGDIITHINSELVLHPPPREGVERLCRLLAKHRGKPVTLTVSKAWDMSKLELFPPCIPLLKSLRINVEDLQRTYFLTRRTSRGKGSEDEEGFNPLLDDLDQECDEEENGYRCLYLGSVNMGERGDVEFIEIGINTILNQTPAGRGHPAILKFTEIHLSLIRCDTDDMRVKFSYPNISSCGRLLSHPQYFSFISAPDVQGQMTSYMCHVFFIDKASLAKEILDQLADGFNRTTFTV